MHSGIDVEGVMLPETGLEAVRLDLEHATDEIGPGVALMAETSLDAALECRPDRVPSQLSAIPTFSPYTHMKRK